MIYISVFIKNLVLKMTINLTLLKLDISIGNCGALLDGDGDGKRT